MFSRFRTAYHSNCPTFLKVRLYPVWVSSNFDPLLPNFHPLFAENIQHSQGFAVLYPMNMHFYASIYAFRWPKSPFRQGPIAPQVVLRFIIKKHLGEKEMQFALNEISAQIVTVFIIIALGYLVGSIHIRGISLGTGAIFLVGLLFGHFGVQTPSALQTVGLLLFITSVGLNVGPTFINRLKKDGKAYFVLCVVVAITGLLICAGMIHFLRVDAALAVGMLAGAFTSSPGFAAAKEAVAGSTEAVSTVAAGYGIIYPMGIICKVLFIQLVPKLLHADIEQERVLIEGSTQQMTKAEAGRKQVSPFGLLWFSITVVAGILLGTASLPLPGGGRFSLGITGGPLMVGLLVGHIGHVGSIDIRPSPELYNPAKEIGLMLFFSGAGVEGGRDVWRILLKYGFKLPLLGLSLILIPLVVGFFTFRKVLKIPLLNGLASMTGCMTSTPSLAVLCQVAGTDDVAVAYATTYPIAMIILVLVVQILLRL